MENAGKQDVKSITGLILAGFAPISCYKNFLFLNLPYFSGMFIARFLIIFIIGIVTWTETMGQQDEFCEAISYIMQDAPNKFRNIRGKLQQANSTATLWDCGIKIPGTIKSRFVASMGLFYEGAFLQTMNKEDVQKVYDKYKELLNKCLGAQGFKMSQQDNFYPGLEHYKKLIFMLDANEKEAPEHPPAHAALEATYSKDLGIYTVVMYIFEH